MTYIIIDFEATCTDKDEFPREEMEIIEWGCVAVDRKTFEIQSMLSTFVKPVRHPILTDFCKQLTSITQYDVDVTSLPFKESLGAFNDWLKVIEKHIFCSWGNYDKNQLIQDCKYHGLEYPFDDKHINIKKMFTDNNRIYKRKGLATSLKRVGIEFEGTQHRGIDDARNMVKLLPYIFGDKRIAK